MHEKKRIRTLWLGLALMTVLPFGFAAADGVGDCVAGEIPSDIVLPDGSVYPAGTLRLCLNTNYSPVSGLHEVSVDGFAVGMYLSQRGESEGLMPHARPYFQFLRLPDGRLKLEAYAVPDGSRYATYTIRTIGKQKRRAATFEDGNLARALPGDSESADRVVLVAAGMN